MLLQWKTRRFREQQSLLKGKVFCYVSKSRKYCKSRKYFVVLVKVDEMYNILKSLLATGSWLRDEGGIR